MAFRFLLAVVGLRHRSRYESAVMELPFRITAGSTMSKVLLIPAIATLRFVLVNNSLKQIEIKRKQQVSVIH